MTIQTVLITGAAGHLGRAVAATFAAQGARRVLLDRNADALRQAFGADTAQQLCLSADLLDSGSTQQAVQSALGQMGQIDVLCHLAGGFGAVRELCDLILISQGAFGTFDGSSS